MAELSTILKDLGLVLRNVIRADATILAFNASVSAQNWIFWRRPQDHHKGFPVPRIVVESNDQFREGWNVAGNKDVSVPFVVHAWFDQSSVGAYVPDQCADRLCVVLEALKGTNGFFKLDIQGCSVDPDPPEDGRVLIHVAVRCGVVWRE